MTLTAGRETPRVLHRAVSRWAGALLALAIALLAPVPPPAAAQELTLQHLIGADPGKPADPEVVALFLDAFSAYPYLEQGRAEEAFEIAAGAMARADRILAPDASERAVFAFAVFPIALEAHEYEFGRGLLEESSRILAALTEEGRADTIDPTWLVMSRAIDALVALMEGDTQRCAREGAELQLAMAGMDEQPEILGFVHSMVNSCVIAGGEALRHIPSTKDAAFVTYVPENPAPPAPTPLRPDGIDPAVYQAALQEDAAGLGRLRDRMLAENEGYLPAAYSTSLIYLCNAKRYRLARAFAAPPGHFSRGSALGLSAAALYGDLALQNGDPETARAYHAAISGAFDHYAGEATMIGFLLTSFDARVRDLDPEPGPSLNAFRRAFRSFTAITGGPANNSQMNVLVRAPYIRAFLVRYLVRVHQVSEKLAPRNRPYRREALRVMDFLQQGQVNESLANSYQRQGSRALQRAVKAAQDARTARDSAAGEFAFAQALKRDNSEALLKRAKALEAEHEAALAYLTGTFPAYAELTQTNVSDLDTIQGQLRPGEAIFSVALGQRESVGLLITRETVSLKVLDLTMEKALVLARALRDGLEPEAATGLPSSSGFHAAAAYNLYTRLFAPFEPDLREVRRIVWIPDGSLQSVPLSVLLTGAPGSEKLYAGQFRDAPWLIRRFQIDTLPSISAYGLMRSRPPSRARKGFAGIGAPALNGSEWAMRSASPIAAGSPDDVAGVIRTLSRLPHAQEELSEMADLFGAGPSALVTGPYANEALVKSMHLEDYRILAFATHGLLAGELGPGTQAGLALTPPAAASDLDDGLLSIEEVARLSLDADLVILSACNTASSDGTLLAQPLSGLARAYFFAGSRSLYVSHWTVNDRSTSSLMLRAAGRLKVRSDRPGEALRAAQLSLLDSEGEEFELMSHPYFWSAFIHVGVDR